MNPVVSSSVGKVRKYTCLGLQKIEKENETAEVNRRARRRPLGSQRSFLQTMTLFTNISYAYSWYSRTAPSWTLRKGNTDETRRSMIEQQMVNIKLSDRKKTNGSAREPK